MKSTFYIVGALIALTLLYGCSDNGEEGLSNEIETAKIEGRNAARNIITRQWHDSIELCRQIEKERKIKSHYDSLGHKRAAESFDSAFVSTIRTVNPILGKFVEKL